MNGLLSPAELADARMMMGTLMTVPATIRRGSLGGGGRSTMAQVWSGECAIAHLTLEQQDEADRLHEQHVELLRFPVTAIVKENDEIEYDGDTRTVVEVEDRQTPHDIQKHVWVTA